MAVLDAGKMLVIVGPTASGKTRLAIETAKKHNGEIICADSRTVFRGMDIGTAKPTKSEMFGVPHWGLDIVDPEEGFSASQFKDYAIQKIAEIRSRGRLPIVVGGTGLYVDAVILDYSFGGVGDEKARAQLEKMTVEELKQYCKANNISLPENHKNKRYIIRKIDLKNQSTTRKNQPDKNIIVVGITTPKDELMERITARAEQILNNGVIDEAKSLGDRYGWGIEPMKANIYRLVGRHLSGEVNSEQLKEESTRLDWRLAKRQITWLKRNKFVQWSSLENAPKLIDSLLEKAE